MLARSPFRPRRPKRRPRPTPVSTPRRPPGPRAGDAEQRLALLSLLALLAGCGGPNVNGYWLADDSAQVPSVALVSCPGQPDRTYGFWAVLGEEGRGVNELQFSVSPPGLDCSELSFPAGANPATVDVGQHCTGNLQRQAVTDGTLELGLRGSSWR